MLCNFESLLTLLTGICYKYKSDQNFTLRMLIIQQFWSTVILLTRGNVWLHIAAENMQEKVSFQCISLHKIYQHYISHLFHQKENSETLFKITLR